MVYLSITPQDVYQQYVRARGSTGAARSAVPLMSRRRLPLDHPLAEVFFAAIESVTTSMSGSSKSRYRTTMEYFLRFLGKHHPPVRTLQQLRRDPHILGWLKWPLLAEPPLVKALAPCMSSLCVV